MIGPRTLIGSCIALVLLSVLLITLSASPAEAGLDVDPVQGAATMPAPHEWVMVVLFFALVIAFHHYRTSRSPRT